MTESVQPPAAGTVDDIVCGKLVDPSVTRWHIHHEGATFYFCSLSCALRFKDRPAEYAARVVARPEGDR